MGDNIRSEQNEITPSSEGKGIQTNQFASPRVYDASNPADLRYCLQLFRLPMYDETSRSMVIGMAMAFFNQSTGFGEARSK